MMFTALVRSATLSALLVAAAACGSPPPGAAVAHGTIERRPAGGDWTAVTEGMVPFENRDSLRAVGGPAELVVACVPPLEMSDAADEGQGPGKALVLLSEGSTLRRRSDSLFDLLSGTADINAGPLKTRFVIFHGAVFLEVHAGHADNAKGVGLKASIEGDEMVVTLRRGAAQLLCPVANPKDLHEVKLMAGETAHAANGTAPYKAGAKPAAEPDGE